MQLSKKQYDNLKKAYNEEYLPFDYGFIEIVSKKIQERSPPYLEFLELWQIDAWKNGSRNYSRIEKNNKNNNSGKVIQFTKAALALVHKDIKESIRILADELDGVGIPVASAIVFFAFPEEFVVIDRYAWNAYNTIKTGKAPAKWDKAFTGGTKEYEEFLLFCQAEAKKLGSGWTPRDVEKALFEYAEEQM